MTRFVHLDYPMQHGGVVRVENAVRLIRGFSAIQAVLHALAYVGAPLRRALVNWAEVRRQREEDRKLWDLALSDARVMADLSRAMSQDALRDTRGYL